MVTLIEVRRGRIGTWQGGEGRTHKPNPGDVVVRRRRRRRFNADSANPPILAAAARRKGINFSL